MFRCPPEFSSARIDLWLVPTNLPTDAMAFLESLLTSEERERIARLRIEDKRTEALVSRSLLRCVLSQTTGQSAPEIVLTIGANGKPCIHDSRLRFNLSHTAGRILLAVTLDHEIGIDIEGIRERSSYEDLARRFFTEAEHQSIMALPESRRLTAFFRCWTRKESILKLSGEGIAGGLQTFTVPVETFHGVVAIPGRGYIRELPVEEGYVAALATPVADAALHFWNRPEDFQS